MKQTLRRCLFAALLSLLFTISLLPATARAAGEDAPKNLYVGSPSDTTNATTSLTVSNNAIVRAENGIKAYRVDEPTIRHRHRL